MTKNIDAFPFLNASENQEVLTTILKLKQKWRVRNPNEDFFVLGASCYAEAQYDFDYYSTLANYFNPTLKTEFAFLYLKLEKFLFNFTGLPVYYSESLCMPGFHILGKPAISGVPHVDAQYRYIPEFRNISKLDEDIVLTFTASIELPSTPSGLPIWPNFKFDGYDQQNAKDFLAYSKRNTAEKYIYKKNEIYIHHGHLLHQLLPAEADHLGTLRITFQGHCIKTEKGLLTYF